jgi:hypothetical protein
MAAQFLTRVSNAPLGRGVGKDRRVVQGGLSHDLSNPPPILDYSVQNKIRKLFS